MIWWYIICRRLFQVKWREKGPRGEGNCFLLSCCFLRFFGRAWNWLKLPSSCANNSTSGLHKRLMAPGQTGGLQHHGSACILHAVMVRFPHRHCWKISQAPCWLGSSESKRKYQTSLIASFSPNLVRILTCFFGCNSLQRNAGQCVQI